MYMYILDTKITHILYIHTLHNYLTHILYIHTLIMFTQLLVQVCTVCIHKKTTCTYVQYSMHMYMYIIPK